MSTRMVLCVVGGVGLSVVLSGCRSLCPEGEKLAAANDSRRAILAYMSCWNEAGPGSERRREIEQRVRGLAEPIVRPVATRWDSQPPMTVPQCDQAIEELEDVRPYDEPGAPWGVAKKITSYRDKRQRLEEEIRELLGTANEQKRDRKWSQAMKSIAGAIEKHPGRSDAKGLRERILTDRDNYYETEIKRLCGAKQWKDATSLLERFTGEEPPPQLETVRTLTEQLKKTRDATVREAAEKDINDKRYFDAYTHITEAQVDWPDLQETIKKDGWRHYVQAANSMLDNVRFFHAYAAAVKAMSLPKPPPAGGEDPEHITFELHRQCADLVDDSIQVEICVAAFDSPASEATAGKEFADRLVNDLHPLLPYGLHLDDRRRAEYAIAERGANVRDGLQLVGVSWAAQGSLSVNFVRDRQESDKTRWVPVKQTIANPQYEADIRALENEYGKDQAKWPAQPSRTITEELTERITYRAGIERMEGEISVSANIYSAQKGSITESQSFRVAREVNDSYSDGIEQAGIEADPLIMISQLSFKQQLEEEMRKRVVDWLLRSFGRRQQKFCEEAQYHIDRREWDQAVRAATQGYAYCLKDNVPPNDEWFVRLRQMALFDLTESTPGPGGLSP